MTKRQDDERPEANTRKSRTSGFLVWYEGTTLAQIARAFAPLGGVFSAVGVVIAIFALGITLYEISEARKGREAVLDEINEARENRESTLFSLLMTNLEAARKTDSDLRKSATKRDGEKMKCMNRRHQLSARHGQIPVIERMVRLDISLRDIPAENVNLVVYRDRKDKSYGINLEGADLEDADLRGANLSKAFLSNATLTDADLDKACMEYADLTGADLRDTSLERAVLTRAILEDADLIGADLYKANLRGANMARTDLTNADLTGTNLTRVENLTQTQLDSACAESDEPPMHLPKDRDGKRLVWNAKECP